MSDLKIQKILKAEIAATRKEFPFSLTVLHLAQITELNTHTIYRRLRKGDIPYANKSMGRWRVPRDVFLSWWYGSDKPLT